jgi:hypothetical protein
MKAQLIQVAALIGFISLSAVAEAKTEVVQSGVYEGRIIRSSFCDLPQGDKRMCQRITVQLGTAKVIDGSLWGGVLTIYDSMGTVLYKGDNNASGGEGWEKFSKGIGYLKVGVNVRMTLSCNRSHCDINQINLK